MRHRKYTPVLALAAASILGRTPLSAGPQPAEECPGAAAWVVEHPDSSYTSHAQPDGTPEVKESALLGELKVRVEKDQSARKRWLAEQGNEELASAVDSIDTENVAWLRKLISEKGFPTAAQVGEEGVHLAWILLQHADQDPKLQTDLLPTLQQRLSAGELPANDLARTTDRVLLASGKPQKYGTQFDWFAGDFSLPEPSELAKLDASRAQLGLMPLADYVCTLRKARSAAK